MSFTDVKNPVPVFTRSLVVITIAGFLLRILAARGELWFDEILTLKLLDRVSSADQIFWRLSHVNNHFLNSLWLWIVGKEAHPIWQRFASILLGTATIPVAAFFIRRRVGDAAGLASAAIFAFGDMFVHYGSEARGYAGLVLMSVLCADAVDRLISEPQRKGPLVRFAIFVALGTLFHFTMVAAVGILGAAAAVIFALDRARWGDGALALLRLTLATILGLAPAVACFFTAATIEPYIVGLQTPFSFTDLAAGLAGMARSTLGIPAFAPDVATLLVTALLAAGALALCPARLGIPCLIALAVVPLLEIWAKAPSLYYPRFHMPTACFLALLAGAGLGLLWTRGGWRRGLALTLATAGLLTHATFIYDLLQVGRGGYRAAIEVMLDHGPTSFDSNYHVENGVVVEFYLARLHKDGLDLAPLDWACDAPPDWYVLTTGGNDPQGPETESFGPADCHLAYARMAYYPSALLSGFNWTLYRRSPQNPPGLDQTLISR